MLFFSVAETIAQQKRLDHFHCNIFGSGSFGEGAFGMYRLPYSGPVFWGHELTHRKSSAQIQHQGRAARHLASRNRILVKDLRMQYQE
jgi:hypothetical protein